MDLDYANKIIGINLGKVISNINEATKNFKGMKVPVELDVNEKTKEFAIKVSSPPISELLKKELSLEKGSDKISVTKVGNASIEDVIKIAKIKYVSMLEKNLKKAVKSILGSCASMGLLVENKDPKEITEEVEKGKYDEEINEGKEITDGEKRKALQSFFQEYKAVQEAKAAAAAPKPEEETKETDKTTAPGKTPAKEQKAAAKSSTTTEKPVAKSPAKQEKKK